jgi:hypothetical protein
MQVLWKGTPQVQEQLRQVALAVPGGIRRALREWAERVMSLSKSQYVPVDTGALRASGFVEGPDQTGTVTLGFGGVAAPYAVIVHEDLQARHLVGGPKYLEQPLKLSLGLTRELIRDRGNWAVRRGIQRLAHVERVLARRAAR